MIYDTKHSHLVTFWLKLGTIIIINIIYYFFDILYIYTIHGLPISFTDNCVENHEFICRLHRKWIYNPGNIYNPINIEYSQILN